MDGNHACIAHMSATIDRGGSGATPDVGSKAETWPQVDAVPRGRATPVRWDDEWDGYRGGSPVCPRCKHTNAVRFRGYWRPGSFHCLRCRVWWNDSPEATCFVCDASFQREDTIHGIRVGSCYHINKIARPFCGSCDKKIGSDRSHHRRTLRRIVGLR